MCVFVLCCDDLEAAERREMERKKTEEKTTLKKLQKLIEKEQKRKNKRPDSKKTKYVYTVICRCTCQTTVHGCMYVYINDPVTSLINIVRWCSMQLYVLQCMYVYGW